MAGGPSLGVILPQVGPLATRESIMAVARRAEELGLDSIWVNDHVVTPLKLESRYPYSATGAYVVQPDWVFLEPLTLLGFAAACTERVQLGTTVIVLPMRNPVLHAKIVSTIHHLTGGRMILGVGAGWMKEEFEALDADFARRGKAFDEYLQVIRGLWTDDNFRFDGETYSVHDLGFSPLPTPGGLPIWIGGHHDAALRRVARWGDGWHPVGMAVEEIPPKWERIKEMAAAHGRDPATLQLSARSGYRRGDIDRTLGRLQPLVEMGVSHIVLDSPSLALDDALANLDYLANEVRPRLAG
jgi:probable F420-dependent oxidoreductase